MSNWISVSGLSQFGRFAIADPDVALVGTGDDVSIDEDRVRLESIFPNPTSGVANVEYRIARTEYVRIELYDALGRLVSVLHDGIQSSGIHVVRHRVDSLPSGIYFVRLTSGSQSLNKALVVTR